MIAALPLQFLLILLFCTSASPYVLKSHEVLDLYDTDSTLFTNDVALWQSSGLVSSSTASSTCGTTLLLGGYQIMGRQGWFRRTYTGLPSHQSISLSMQFWLIDGWSYEDILTVYISNGTKTTMNNRVIKLAYTEFAGTGQLCGSSIVKDQYPVYLFVRGPHQGDTLVVEVFRSSLSDNEIAYFGIRQVSILLSSYTVSSLSYYGVSDPTTLIAENRLNCAAGTYGGSCSNCHPACGACYGSGTSSCYYCSTSYYYNGYDCLPCDPSCATCDGGKATQCLTCPSGSYMFNNGSCINNCPSPYTSGRIVNLVEYCDFPCTTSEYYYANGTCGTFVEFPYQALADGLNWFASYPCNSTQYITPGRVCLDSCVFPMTIDATGGILECTPPCSSDKPYYLVEEAICNATCLPPFIIKESYSFYECYRVRDQSRFKIMDSMAVPISLTLIGLSVVFPGFPWAILVMIVSRMIQYVRYLKIDYSKELDQLQATWNLRFISLNLGIEVPEGFYSGGSLREIKNLYTEFGTYSLFDVNYWNPLLFLASSTIMLGIFYLIELIIRHFVWNASAFKVIRYIRTVFQNLTIIAIYSTFGNIFFFSALQFWKPSMDTVGGTVSFVLTIFVILAGLAMLVANFYFLRKQQQLRKGAGTREGKRKIQKYIDDSPGLAVLFKHFKVESVFQQSFLLFYVIREILYMIIVLFFPGYPLIQCLAILALCLVALIYIATSVAFVDYVDTLQMYAYEALMVVYTFAAAVVSVMDDDASKNISTRTLLGKVITILFLVFPFMVIGFTVIKVARMCYKLYQEHNKKSNLMNNILVNNRKIEQQSIDFSSSPNLGTMPLQITEMEGVGSANNSPNGRFTGVDMSHDMSFNLNGDQDMSFNNNDNTENSFVLNRTRSQSRHNSRRLLNPQIETREKSRTVTDDIRETVQQKNRAQLRAKRRVRGLSNPLGPGGGAQQKNMGNPMNQHLSLRPRKVPKEEANNNNYNFTNFPVRGLQLNNNPT